jgi:hypothetical protein
VRRHQNARAVGKLAEAPTQLSVNTGVV